MPVKRMSEREWKREKEALIARIAEKATKLDEKERELRLAKSKEDFFHFCYTYLPHYFAPEIEPAPFHREIFRLAEAEKTADANRPIAVAAPRGFSKSTVFSLAYVMWNALFELRKFIIIVSGNDILATALVENVKTDFEQNVRIKDDFGKVFISGAKNYFTVKTTGVMARTWRQGVRGLRHGPFRPDMIVMDDLEKDKEAGNPAIVEEMLDRIKSNIYPALARKGALLLWLGTIIKKRSALGKALESDEEPYQNWERRLYRALNTGRRGKEASLWPSYFPPETLKDIKRNIGTVAFEREYQQNPTDDEGAIFKEEWIRFFEDGAYEDAQITAAMFIDPSAGDSAKKKNDYKAIVIVGLDREAMRFPVLETWIKRTSIDSFLHATFRLYQKYKRWIKVVGLEANGFQSLLKRDYDRLAKEYGYYMPIRLITHSTAKSDRIERLSPLVENGRLLFRKGNQDDSPLLIEQILYFPTAAHDDGPDALEGAVRLLETPEPKPGGMIPGQQRKSKRILRGFKD